MANSITFNGTNLSAYNLIVLAHNLPATRETEISRVENKGISGDARLVPMEINLDVIIQGTSVSNVMSLLDSIKKVLNTQETVSMIVGLLSDRYWQVKFVSLQGDLMAQKNWRGTITFLAPDPLAYDTTESDTDYDIDTDPESISEVAGGTAIIRPVFTYTAGTTLTGVTITLTNSTTGESIVWTGNMTEGQELVIDCERWVVELEGTASMSGVTGEFPTLIPGTNSLSFDVAFP